MIRKWKTNYYKTKNGSELHYPENSLQHETYRKMILNGKMLKVFPLDQTQDEGSCYHYFFSAEEPYQHSKSRKTKPGGLARKKRLLLVTDYMSVYIDNSLEL